MFVQLSKIIPKTLFKFGFSKQAKAAFICEKFRQIAAEDIPPKILTNIWPKRYQNGILTIAVTHPILAQELMERKHGLLKKMNKTIMKEWPGLKKEPVKDIKTQVSETGTDYGGEGSSNYHPVLVPKDRLWRRNS